MARPAEKARAMLNKWVKMREQGNQTIDESLLPARRKRRPHLASECEHLSDAEYYRSQIIREISAGIAKIQNPGLGEHALRDLNDEINKKMREKYHWNKRIKDLGGLDYNVIERKRQIEEGDKEDDTEGQAHQPAHVYRYYGAAKDLPGVRELIAKQNAKWRKKKFQQGDIHKRITPNYFGWRDEEDGVLQELEDQYIKKLLSENGSADNNDNSINNNDNKRQKIFHNESNNSKGKEEDEEEDEDRDYLDVPSPELLAQVLLEHKKKELLARFS